MENNTEYKVDIISLVEQTMDAHVNNTLLDIFEKDGDEKNLAFFKLLNEYGIYGNKALEFINKASTLFAILEATGDVVSDEEEEAECD
jgi:hypothetical protein